MNRGGSGPQSLLVFALVLNTLQCASHNGFMLAGTRARRACCTIQTALLSGGVHLLEGCTSLWLGAGVGAFSPHRLDALELVQSFGAAVDVAQLQHNALRRHWHHVVGAHAVAGV